LTAFLKGEKEFMDKVGDPKFYQCHTHINAPTAKPRDEFMFAPDYMG